MSPYYDDDDDDDGSGEIPARICVTTALGRPLPARGWLVSNDPNEAGFAVELEQRGSGELGVEVEEDWDPDAIVVVPQVAGFWATRVNLDGADGNIRCEGLPQTGNPSWWHRLIGSAIDVPARGQGIRIGVVDGGFAVYPGLEHVHFVTIAEELRADFPRNPFWDHGEAVCRIIADKGAPGCCAAIAPGAELFFASASFTAATRSDRRFSFDLAGGTEDDLDPRMIARAIFELAVTHEVHIINLSLGVWDKVGGESGIERAIRLARSLGVLVVVAAGNTHRDEAAFPAILDCCVGVGAYGDPDWGPPDSVARHMADHAGIFGNDEGEPIFYDPESAYGTGVDVVAPGVGILIGRGGKAAFDLLGTSFAAPIVSGILAIELSTDATYLRMPRDEARARHAEDALATLCRDSGFFPGLPGHNIVGL